MAAENVRANIEEMKSTTKNILIYIQDVLYPTVHNLLQEKINSLTNKEEIQKWVQVGRQEEQNIIELLFNKYREAYDALKSLSLQSNKTSNSDLIKIKSQLNQLQPVLQKWMKAYTPRNVPRNRLIHRNEETRNRSRSPLRNRTRLNRNRNRNHTSMNLSRRRGTSIPQISKGPIMARSIMRNKSREPRGSIRINPIAIVRKTNALGTRGNMTYTSAEIKQMSNKAVREIYQNHGNIEGFKRSMSNANRIAREAAEIAAEASAAPSSY